MIEATPLPELEYRTLHKKGDWLGGYVRVRRAMFNQLIAIPAGLVCHVRTNRGGLALNAQPCTICGLFVDILPVRETEVEYLGHPRVGGGNAPRELRAGDGLSKSSMATIARERDEWLNAPLSARRLRRKSDWDGAHVRISEGLAPHQDTRGFWSEGVLGKVRRHIRGGRLVVHSLPCERCGVAGVSHQIKQDAVVYLGHPTAASSTPT